MPITVKSTGGGSVTLTAPNTASDLTLTMPSISGTIYATTGGVIPVSEGGTGSSTLTANNVLLGNGTSALQAVAPGTNGNVLTSNGTTWTSAALPAGGVTSLAAGGGITVSGATGAVTVSQDFYTGSSYTNTSFPIGSYMTARDVLSGCCAVSTPMGTARPLYAGTNAVENLVYRGDNGVPSIGGTVTAVTGTWRSRGYAGSNVSSFLIRVFQRVA